MTTTIILTGATRGIGRAAAEAFGRHDVELGLVGRDANRVREAAAAARAGGRATVREHVADLADLSHVRRLADELQGSYRRIDVLANNAGAMFTSRHLSADGFELTFALNHLAPYLLTRLLLDRLRAGDGRVVTTASDAHRGGRLDPADVQGANVGYRAFRAYSASKLANVLFTRELQRRHPDLTANCFHPGVIRSGFGKNDGFIARLGLTAAGPFMRPPETGAERLLWLALDPGAAELRGEYVEKNRPVEPSPLGRDPRLAEQLWEQSAEMVGLPA